MVARDVTLEIDSPEGVSVESLTPFPFEPRGGRTVVSLGSLVAEQVVQVVLRLNFPFGEIGRETGAVLSLSARDDTEVVAGANVSLSWEYADPKTNDLQPRDVEVDRAVARIFAARARQEATGLNRAGNFAAAQAMLLSVSKRIRSYAGRDAEMRAVVAELERDASEVAAPMAARSLKEMHFRGYSSAKCRMVDGKAMRGPKPTRTPASHFLAARRAPSNATAHSFVRGPTLLGGIFALSVNTGLTRRDRPHVASAPPANVRFHAQGADSTSPTPLSGPISVR